jgi:hypothetical protein
MAAQPTYFTLTTTDGRAAVVPVPAGQDRWLIAVRYVRAYFLGEVYLDDLRPATSQEIAAFQAEHPHARLEWLADDP